MNTMTWTRGGRYYLISDRGYKVSKGRFGPAGALYVSYGSWSPPQPPHNIAQFLGDDDTAEAAKQRCEEHHAERG
jgi:hypothetical protein